MTNQYDPWIQAEVTMGYTQVPTTLGRQTTGLLGFYSTQQFLTVIRIKSFIFLKVITNCFKVVSIAVSFFL